MMSRLGPVRHRVRGSQVRAGPAAGPRGRLHRPGQGLRGAGEVRLDCDGEVPNIINGVKYPGNRTRN